MKRNELILHVAENIKNGRDEIDGLYVPEALDNDAGMVILASCEFYSLKPRTHIVNGFDVPAPVKSMSIGEQCFYPNESDPDWYESDTFDGGEWDMRVLKRNSCFATKEAAIANAKARCGIDPNKE